MGRDNHFNLVIFNRLERLVGMGDYLSLLAYLSRLSHAQFRTAGYILGERVADSLSPSAFWALFEVLTQYNSRAFLVTMLKAFVRNLSAGKLSLMDDGFAVSAGRIASSSLEVQKTLNTLLPALKTPEQIHRLFMLLRLGDMQLWIPFLLRSFHPATAFVLLQALHYSDPGGELPMQVARHLMGRGDSLAFNVASLIKSIHGLEQLHGTFSLTLEPFQLSRIEASFDAFLQELSLDKK